MKNVIIKLICGLSLTATLAIAGICGAAAYIDPSVVTFGASAIAGIVIAAGAVLFVWWRKVKSKVADKLGIDENANKEKEEELIITVQTEDEATAETAAEQPETADRH